MHACLPKIFVKFYITFGVNIYAAKKKIILVFSKGLSACFLLLRVSFYQLLTATMYAHKNLYCHQSFIDLHENSENLEIYVTLVTGNCE